MPGTRHKNPKEKADMPMCRKDAKFVGYFSNGGLRCPCFGYRRRGKPRNLKYKSNLREEMEKH